MADRFLKEGKDLIIENAENKNYGISITQPSPNKCVIVLAEGKEVSYPVKFLLKGRNWAFNSAENSWTYNTGEV